MVFNARKRYPWRMWLDGQVWELTQGEDFSCSITGMRVAARQAASRRGLGMRTTQNTKQRTICIQAIRLAGQAELKTQ